MKVTIYHNPRCSKSRATLELLRQRGVETEIVEYLVTPLSRSDLESLLTRLGISARALARTAEPAWAECGLDIDSGDEEIVDAMLRFPILIERPIVVRGERAIIGRPPENVLALIGA